MKTAQEIVENIIPPKGDILEGVESAGWAVHGVAAWYDAWVGFYFDRQKRRLYVLPLPCVGIYIQFPSESNRSAKLPKKLTEEGQPDLAHLAKLQAKHIAELKANVDAQMHDSAQMCDRVVELTEHLNIAYLLLERILADPLAVFRAILEPVETELLECIGQLERGTWDSHSSGTVVKLQNLIARLRAVMGEKV